MDDDAHKLPGWITSEKVLSRDEEKELNQAFKVLSALNPKATDVVTNYLLRLSIRCGYVMGKLEAMEMLLTPKKTAKKTTGKKAVKKKGPTL